MVALKAGVQVGPNYDEMELNDVRLMDLTTIQSMANPQAQQAISCHLSLWGMLLILK